MLRIGSLFSGIGGLEHPEKWYKHNNEPSNLRLCTVKEHREYHLQLEYLAVLLVRQGKIKFSDDVGYYLVEENQS